jgi:hypothetical protein
MAAVNNGLGVTARTEHALVPGTAILAPPATLPALPLVDVVLRHARQTRIGDVLERLFNLERAVDRFVMHLSV